jgi:hypothetical protein
LAVRLSFVTRRAGRCGGVGGWWRKWWAAGKPSLVKDVTRAMAAEVCRGLYDLAAQ